MKRWLVTVPIAGAVTIEVEAETEKGAISEALEHAFDDVTCEGFDELEAYPYLHRGNVSYVSCHEAEVECLGNVEVEKDE